MTLAANAIQRAIYTRLADMLDGVPVYDHVPQDAAFPYVVIGADTSIPWDSKSGDGQEFTCTIHAWDAARAGRRSVKAILEQIHAALHQQEDQLDVPDFRVALIRCEFAETFQEAGYEGDTDRYYHGVMRFRALVHDDS